MITYVVNCGQAIVHSTTNRGPTIFLKNAGGIAFWVQDKRTGWATNGARYDFGKISAYAMGYPDSRLEIGISGPFGETFTFIHPTPSAKAKGIRVEIRWKDGKVTLHLNGDIVETKKSTALIPVH